MQWKWAVALGIALLVVYLLYRRITTIGKMPRCLQWEPCAPSYSPLPQA